MTHSELARLARRLGRIGIGFISGLAGLVAMAVAWTAGRPLTLDITDDRVEWVWAIGLVAFMSTFLLFEWLGVVPRDDPERPPSIRDTSEYDRATEPPE